MELFVFSLPSSFHYNGRVVGRKVPPTITNAVTVCALFCSPSLSYILMRAAWAYDRFFALTQTNSHLHCTSHIFKPLLHRVILFRSTYSVWKKNITISIDIDRFSQVQFFSDRMKYAVLYLLNAQIVQSPNPCTKCSTFFCLPVREHGTTYNLYHGKYYC